MNTSKYRRYLNERDLAEFREWLRKNGWKVTEEKNNRISAEKGRYWVGTIVPHDGIVTVECHPQDVLDKFFETFGNKVTINISGNNNSVIESVGSITINFSEKVPDKIISVSENQLRDYVDRCSDLDGYDCGIPPEHSWCKDLKATDPPCDCFKCLKAWLSS